MPAVPSWPPRSLPRLFVTAELAPGAAIALDSGQANYLGNVLRMKQGDRLQLFNGSSGEWLAEVTEAQRRRMLLSTISPTRAQEAVPDLWLAFAPLKKGRVDWLVEKAVELGVARLVPVITRRTIVDKLNLERLRAHIIEAAEQCGRTALASIDPPVRLPEFLASRDSGRTLFFADENGGPPPSEAMQSGAALILVGPEGGFTEEEAALLRSAANCRPIGLGPRILRAETAALAAVAAWMALAGDWQ